MLEIVIMYSAVAVIFPMSLAIGFIKSTRAVIVFGGLLTLSAIACGVFMRNYELVNTVLDYVKTQGESVFATSREWSNMQLLSFGVVILMGLLLGICVCFDAHKGTRSTTSFYVIAMLSFVMSFHLSDKRDIVASWNDVSSDVISKQELYHLGDDNSGIDYEIGVINSGASTDWYSVSNPIAYKYIDSNWEWRVTKNGVRAEMENIWSTRVRYTGIETDNVSPFMTWLKVNDVKLKVIKITRTEVKVVMSNKYYPNITQTFNRYIMDVELEPENPNWRTEFENWKSTVNELNQLSKPKSHDKD